MNCTHAKKHPLPASGASHLAGLAFDVEPMLTACVPGGSILDPQVVANNIRAWVADRKPAELAEQQGLVLPPLPEAFEAEFACPGASPVSAYTSEQMQEYARDALAATGKQQGGEVQGDGRAQFEAWAHAQSYRGGNIITDRHADHPDVYACPNAQLTWQCWKAALAARRPGAQVPVATAIQPGKRVSILVSACGPARKFDPVSADAELASVQLVPLWELPELHPRKVASECLTTMEHVRRATRPNTINRVKLTDAVALVGRFVAQLERSERLGAAQPAQGIDLAALQGVSDEYNACIHFHAAGEGDYDDFLRKHAYANERDAAPEVGS